MSNKSKELNRVKVANKLRAYVGWFGVLTPVFGAGVLTGIGLLGAISPMFIVQVTIVSAINYFVGRMLLKPVPAIRGERER